MHYRPASSDSEGTTPTQILEDRAEGLMDRLVLWQMALPLAGHAAEVDVAPAVIETRDWTQAFCDDIVQPL